MQISFISNNNHKLKVYCRRNKINKKARDHIYENANELKNCFRQDSKQEAINQFKQYYKITEPFQSY